MPLRFSLEPSCAPLCCKCAAPRSRRVAAVGNDWIELERPLPYDVHPDWGVSCPCRGLLRLLLQPAVVAVCRSATARRFNQDSASAADALVKVPKLCRSYVPAV